MGPAEDPERGLAGLSHLFLSRPHTQGDAVAVESPGSRPEPLFVSGGSDLLLPAYAACGIAIQWARRGERPVVVDPDAGLPLGRFLSENPALLGGGERLPWVPSVVEAQRGNWTRVLVVLPNPMLRSPSVPAGVSRLLIVVAPEAAEVARAYAAIQRVVAFNGHPWLGIAWREDAPSEGAGAPIRGFHRFLRLRTGCAPVDCGRIPRSRTSVPADWAAEIAEAADPADPAPGPTPAASRNPSECEPTRDESALIEALFPQTPGAISLSFFSRKNLAP